MADLHKILKGLLGENGADAVHATVDQAAKTLDAAGVKRKEGESEGGGEAAAGGGEAILAAVESAGAAGPAQIVKNIIDKLKGEALTALEEKLGSNEAVVTLLLEAVSAPTTPVSETPADVPAEAEMMKSLKDYIASTTKDMGYLARGQVDIAKAVGAMVSENKGLRDRLEKLESHLNDRPRQASKAPETEIEGTDSKLKEAAEDSVGETALIAGIRVKKQPGDK